MGNIPLWNEVLLGLLETTSLDPQFMQEIYFTSAAMYDSWAIFDSNASPYFLNQVHNGRLISFQGFSSSVSDSVAIHEMMAMLAMSLEISLTGFPEGI